MAQEITTSAKGLVTNPNYLDAPPGSLKQAENCVISRPGIIEPRRGFNIINNMDQNPSDPGVPLAEYQKTFYWDREGSGSVVAIKGNPMNFNTAPLQFGYIDGTYTFVPVGSIDSRVGLFRNAVHDNNFYITSINGVLRQSNSMLSTSLYPVGVPTGYIMSTSGSAPGSGSAIAPDCQVAYRTVWWFTDEAGINHEGPPSGRVTYINQGIQIGPGQMAVVGGTATFTPTGGHPFVSGQLVNLGNSVLVEPNVPMGDYTVLAATGNLNFAINLGNGLTFSNNNVFRVGNSARFGKVQVQIPRGIPEHGNQAKVSGTAANYYFQLYRAPASVQSDVEASDEMGLVWESEPITSITGCLLTRAAASLTASVDLPGVASSSFQAGDFVEVVSTTSSFLSGAYKIVAVAPNASGHSFQYVVTNAIGADVTASNVTLNPWTITVTDTINDGLAGASLYTNPNQEGILQSNDAPPAATDLAFFKNSMFYADTTSRHRASMQLNTVSASWISGSPGPTASNPDDYLFPGMTLYMHAYDGVNDIYWNYKPAFITDPDTENPMADKYAVYPPQVYTSYSPAQCIELTAQSLVSKINADYRNKWVRAYYASNADDIPGKISMEAVGISTITSLDQFWGQMGMVSGTASAMVPSTVTSSADVWPNGLFYSKDQQSEGCPISNYFRVGEPDKKILRIQPLQNALIVVKEDGIWRVVGDSASNFRVEVLDNTVICQAPESCASMNNKMYMFTQYGVVEVTEQGVEVISAVIDDQMRAIIDYTSRRYVSRFSFGLADPENRKYYFWFPVNQGPDDTNGIPVSASYDSNVALVYDFYTQAWTSISMNATSACIDPNKHTKVVTNWFGLYEENVSQLGTIGGNSNAWKDYTDYLLPNYGQLVSVSGSNTVFKIAGDVALLPGDIVAQPIGSGSALGGNINWVKTSDWTGFSAVSSTIELEMPFTGSLSQIVYGYQSILSAIIWTPKAGGNTGGVNQYRECGFAYRNGFFWDGQMSVGFYGDYLGATFNSPADFSSVYVSGTSKYALIPPTQWDPAQESQAFRIRVGVPRNQQRCSELSILLQNNTAGNVFQIQNMSVTLNNVSEKQGKK